ncbi:unnamed protein product [Caenorhabditis auriculariae]|uniref:Tubulin-specific chaperone A n=1 Tax=Caenorhabditis auriculariae TaxID=2777116 RepID=A0A8S1GTT1_9PELO|nr:unnamed protein product [Caenorhabditis auriculariae]
MSDAAVIKQVKIKTGVVKRLLKERVSYIKEAENETAKVQAMKAQASNEDEEYAAKKAEAVLQETRNMVGDAARRCATAAAELRKLLEEAKLDPESQEAKDAQEQLGLCEGVVA